MNIKYFSESELVKFFTILRKSKHKYAARDLLIFSMVYAFGLRIGELVRLRLVDVKPSLDNPQELYIERLKSGVSRHYPLEITEKGTDFSKLMSKYLRERKKLKYAKKNDFLFITNHSQLSAISIVYLEQLMARIGEQADIPRHLCHPHSLRHSCAISLINQGCDIYTVSAHLGHNSIKTTVQFYAQLSPKDWLKKSSRNIKTRLAGI